MVITNIVSHILVIWKVEVKCMSYLLYFYAFFLRIEELFDIIVEYPDSEPALADLRECLHHVELRNKVVSSLKNA